jgi:hypothetical protein
MRNSQLLEVLCECCEKRESRGPQQSFLSSISRTVLVDFQLRYHIHGPMMHGLGRA